MSLALILALAVPLASASFRVDLQADIVQRRDVVDPGHQVAELVRILPPREEPWTMAVHVPDSWLDRPRSSGQSPSDAAIAARGQLNALVSAVQQDIPWSGGLAPIDAAGLWAGLLRNSAYANPHPVSHYQGVLQPWEVLYDAQAGDTLSAAFTALLALEAQGVDASLCSYPTPSTSTGLAFGLILEGTAPDGADWAWAIQGVTPTWVLLPLHLKAKPTGELEASQLQVWSIDEVKAVGWSPGTEPASDGLADADPASTPDPAEPPQPAPAPAPAPPPQRTPRPDICDQAEAMGLECRPADHSNDLIYLAIAVLALASLTAAGIGSWRGRSRRQAAAQARRQRRQREDF